MVVTSPVHCPVQSPESRFSSIPVKARLESTPGTRLSLPVGSYSFSGIRQNPFLQKFWLSESLISLQLYCTALYFRPDILMVL